MPNRTSSRQQSTAAVPAPLPIDEPAPKRWSISELFRRIDESLAEL